MAIEILRPSGAGVETDLVIGGTDPAATNWESVDEVVSDVNETLVLAAVAEDPYKRDLYSLPASSGSGTINKITLYFVVKSTSDDFTVKGVIRSDSTITETAEKNPRADFGNDTYGEYSQEWAVNPADSQPWAWADIDALQIGIALDKISFDITYCTQVYVEVDYTPPGDIDTAAKRRMAAGIVPFHSVIIPDGTIGLKDRMQIACLYSENAVAAPGVGIPIHFMYYQRMRRN